MPGPYVLLQFGADAHNTKFEDLEGRPAFTVSEVAGEVGNPNLVLKIIREAAWSQQHPNIMGPAKSFFYFGPNHAPGYLVYGNGPTSPMVNSMRQKKDTSTSRYFTAQNGKDYKWRITPQRMECVDGRSTIAVWELSDPDDEYHARLTVKASGLAIVTELLTTLTLNRISQFLNW